MIFYSEKNVYEAALDRMRYIFSEFSDRKIIVSLSGGKDSTVVMHLAHEVMGEFGYEKLPVFFLDQEIEAPMTIDYIRRVMSLPWVEPMWVQSFYKKWNANGECWLNVWGPGEKWMRPKEPNSYHDIPQIAGLDEDKHNIYELASHAIYPGCINMTGVRIDESPTRRDAFLWRPTYKGITWATRSMEDSYTFCPIYDWNTKDIWKYIFMKHLDYNEIYNYYFTKMGLNKMRVGAFVNQQSIRNLSEIKEIDQKFYDDCIKRVKGVNTTTQSLDQLIKYVNDNGKPSVFVTWDEYIHYLIDHLVDDDVREKFRIKIFKMIERYRKDCPVHVIDELDDFIGVAAVNCILICDYKLVKLSKLHLPVYKFKKEHEKTEAKNK